ncbi:hypothetical protein B5F10_07220 [Anaerotruncus colihominis]|uniref:Uncharacterized protein n=1 Tax=Anaerotruncus colihominis TaxID=169435 RepID=A0A1Y4N0L2_9FIRM|nr:hypothetical protein [Anaerotruncus colihominis]OUP69507.1 hypothetical protein B5F11_09180 [Anaerotruncus colihominis]OUP74445.1 hypothetical protein B5F10_07220 [Anaerotruncus colihominis]
MRKLFKLLLAAAIAALAAAALAAPAFASGLRYVAEGYDSQFLLDPDQVEVVQVINRDLHASYWVTGPDDLAAVIGAVNSVSYQTGITEQPEEEGLRLLHIRMKDGATYNYWCHSNILMVDDVKYAHAQQVEKLYTAMAACEQNYPANIEWLGYMNPYRVTKMELLHDGQKAVYESKLSATNREAILDITRKLKTVKVSSVHGFYPKDQIATPSSGPERNYAIRLTFEDGKEFYDIYILGDRIDIAVDSIPEGLSYTSGDASLLKLLTDALDAKI